MSRPFPFRCLVRSLLTCWLIIGVAFAGALPIHAADDDNIADKYPGLAEAEQPASRSAECKDLRANLKNLPDDLDRRVDLWVTGNLTAMQTDGALWYVSLCLAPDIKVLCVTYQPNDLKIGDRIFARGAYMRPDNDHIMLDPCLASASDQDDNDATNRK